MNLEKFSWTAPAALFIFWHEQKGNFFETKFIPEQFASTTAAYEEIQSASLEQRKRLGFAQRQGEQFGPAFLLVCVLYTWNMMRVYCQTFFDVFCLGFII